MDRVVPLPISSLLSLSLLLLSCLLSVLGCIIIIITDIWVDKLWDKKVFWAREKCWCLFFKRYPRCWDGYLSCYITIITVGMFGVHLGTTDWHNWVGLLDLSLLFICKTCIKHSIHYYDLGGLCLT